MKRRILTTLGIVSFLAFPFFLGRSDAGAASDKPYYEGKTIKIVVTSSPGGGTDSAARLAARFLPKHLPGNPKTIVQNMSGGAGSVPHNVFTAEAKPDGLTLLADSSSGMTTFIRGGPMVKYDPRKYRAIGALPRGGTVVMVRRDARARLLDPKAKPVVVGDADGTRTWLSMTLWGSEFLGWNQRWVYGYPGTAELALALRQSEIDLWSTSNAKLIKDLVKEGVVDLVTQQDSKRRVDFPDVPSFIEVLGPKKPAGVPWQAYQNWVGPSLIDKILYAAPGTPDHIMKLLREAYLKMPEDSEFKKQADQFFGPIWSIMPGEEAEQMVKESTTLTKEVENYLVYIRKKYGLPLGTERG
jgi:tripartite-type tricarboxylate transporter receptor subunit TctC